MRPRADANRDEETSGGLRGDPSCLRGCWGDPASDRRSRRVFGLTTHLLAPYYGTTLRFLVAALLVTAPYAELLESRDRRIRHIPVDERQGFRPRNV
ncbi:MAG: hypothetical protein L0206_23230 [Actinobacteria bacterium]|nr:hypothetical protein [Actinomycetota bacterium]